jgi:spoIIIJ-associated protein
VSSREYVDVRGPSVETAIEAGLEELGLKSQDEAEIEVLQQPTRGFLGIGGEGAVVRIRRKPPKPSNGRRSRGSGGDSRRPRGGAGTKPRESDQRSSSGGRGEERGSKSASSPKPRPPKRDDRSKEREEMRARPDDRDVIGVDEQAAEIERFLKGLLEAFGLEGKVSVRVEEEIIYADVAGEQTEALVGTKGVILQSVLELCRTIVQRKTQEGARIRLDIAGYTERRREALRIYARRLADKVIAEGGEVMLEPMNSADRKVVHDTVGEIDGVRSYSEGEEPHRSVIVAAE